MQISDKQLFHLPVYTQSGEWVGRILRFSVDCDNQLVGEYIVAKFPYIQMLANERAVPRTAVISITAEKMIVDDGMIRLVEPSVLANPLPITPTIEG